MKGRTNSTNEGPKARQGWSGSGNGEEGEMEGLGVEAINSGVDKNEGDCMV